MKLFKATSEYIQLGKDKVHIKVFEPEQQAKATPILAIPGSVEDGRIFYSNSGRGLAPWLAEQGYTVYVPDLRGRGLSTPKAEKGGGADQTTMLNTDIPAYIDYVKQHSGNSKQHWMAHSWGGIQLLAYLAKNELQVEVEKMVFFGSKRHIATKSWRKWVMVNLAWVRLGEYLVNKHGYLPAIKWKMGSENEHAELYRQTRYWVMNPDWKDENDDFDYAAALQQKNLPLTLLTTGAHDWVLGNPADVARLKWEMGDGDKHKVKVFGKEFGNQRNYGHIDLLKHPLATEEVFPEVLEWINK